MQTLTAHDFAYNFRACKYLRGIPPILLKARILQIGGRGVPEGRDSHYGKSETQLKNRSRCSAVGTKQLVIEDDKRRRCRAISRYAQLRIGVGTSEPIAARADQNPPK